MRILKILKPKLPGHEKRWFASQLQFASDGEELLLELTCTANHSEVGDYRCVGRLDVSKGHWEPVGPCDGFWTGLTAPHSWRRDFSCVVLAGSADNYRQYIHVTDPKELLNDPPIHIDRRIASKRGVFIVSGVKFSQDGRWMYLAECWFEERAHRSGIARVDVSAVFEKPILEKERVDPITNITNTHRSIRPQQSSRFAILPKGVWISTLGLSPDGSLAAAGSPKGDTYLIRVRGGKQLAVLRRKRRKPDKAVPVERLAFSPSGKQLGVVVDGMLRVWDVKTAKLLWDAEDAKAHAIDLAYHPDGKTIAVARSDGAAVFLDAQSGALRKRYDWKVGQLNSIAFSPDGLTCAAGGEKGQVIVWDVDS